MKGRLKSIIVIAIALMIAIFTGFYLMPQDVEKTRLTTRVVRLKDNIGKNQQIKLEHLDVIEIGSYNLPDYIVNNPSDIIGKYAIIPMHKGEFAILKYFQDEKVPDDAFLYEDISFDGISFETDLSKCVGGIPRKSDKVRVIIYKQAKDRDSESDVLIYDELSNLEVIKVANKNGISIEEAKNGGESINNSVVPGVVTVKANVNQQKLLVKGIYDGVIHLALRPRILIDDKKQMTLSIINEDMRESSTDSKDNKEIEEIKEKNEDVNGSSEKASEDNANGGFKIDD